MYRLPRQHLRGGDGPDGVSRLPGVADKLAGRERVFPDAVSGLRCGLVLGFRGECLLIVPGWEVFDRGIGRVSDLREWQI